MFTNNLRYKSLSLFNFFFIKYTTFNFDLPNDSNFNGKYTVVRH